MEKTVKVKQVFLTGLLAGAAILGSSNNAFSAMEEASVSRASSVFPTPREVLQEGLNPHVGVTAGVTNPEGSYKSGGEYGVSFGFQPYIPFGLGMSLTFSQNEARDNGARSLDRTAVLVRGSYNFGGATPVIKNSYVGVATGPIINQDATYFGLAPILGFDIPVREWSGQYLSYLSIGAEARYMIVSSNESDALTVNGVLKYWF